MAVGLFPVKLLTPDEDHRAVSEGDEGGVKLARRFMERGDGRCNWRDRPSVLEKPEP